MIGLEVQADSEEEPDSEQPPSALELPQLMQRPPGNHPNPDVTIDLDELSQQLIRPGFADPVCRHMRSRSLFADIVCGGNQHGRWPTCTQCEIKRAIQTLDLMSCVNCSLTHFHQSTNDLRKTCVWTKWLRMIARYRFRMTDSGRTETRIREKILRCQDRRRMRAITTPPALEE